MSESHTPGPWSIERYEGEIIGFKADDIPIIDVDYSGFFHMKESDARLIAAAPALLAAARLVLREWDENKDYELVGLIRAFDALRAVAEHAEGP